MTAGLPLPYGDPAHLAAHQFLVEEAALLDAADYAGWLGLLCEDIRYVMPVRVTTARGADFDSLADMGHFDEDMYALRKRVQRLATDHAWTEDPPSRTRHFVTNVRTFRPGAGELRAESALLLFRSRGDTREPDLISAEEVALGLSKRAWRTIRWREGSADWLSSRFARVRVRVGHNRLIPELASQEWLLIEWPEGEAEPTKYWLSTLPADISFRQLVDFAKLRWRIERDYQELKQEVGLGHYEGRGWRGFHHHATMCIAAYGFLISERETIPPSGYRSAALFPQLAVPDGYRPRGSAIAA